MEALFEDAYAIIPDISHSPVHNTEGLASFDFIDELKDAPRPVSILYGSKNAPYLRYDPYYTLPPTQKRHRQALARLEEELERHVQHVRLSAGQLLLIDNARAVHGRAPFTARYDGTDRWLKRGCLTLDLGKSRAQRTDESCRLIGGEVHA
jgi:hypothetical protein